MAYKEPYPVITKWPGTTGYSIGTKRCFHYTLTYAQVKKLADDADHIGRGTDINTLAGIGIPSAIAAIARKALSSDLIKIGGKAFMGAATATGLFMAWCNYKQQLYLNECIEIGNIWSEISNFMKFNSYKRVTISQLIELDAIYGIDIFPEGFPVWRYAAHPRVPDISYYYRK
ncbi:hypothetical protein RBU49_13510 [Clostridium sp. MB40-C1]|uniref:hypothetical protein n=1 Tax=Clostridium sp. MB40-C1 TaxID=3070996 RepID=UPI0027E18EE4|nr:hypothetical protein [Clostridium sp. MB40-C1]WMJ79874.1 hypothetical protein RBU49_13510 [Clostridium sp. MB40-C1]